MPKKDSFIDRVVESDKVQIISMKCDKIYGKNVESSFEYSELEEIGKEISRLTSKGWKVDKFKVKLKIVLNKEPS